MKCLRSLVLFVSFLSIGLFGNSVRATVIVDDTFADGVRTNWNLPTDAPWYSWTSGTNAFIGVEPNSLYLTNQPGVTRYFWTYFTTNAPELTEVYAGGVTNNISNNTNAFYGYPIDLAVGQKLQLTLRFQLSDVLIPSGNQTVRFGLMDYDTNNVVGAWQGRVIRDTSNITKSGTNVTGYRLDIPIYQTFSTNSIIGLRERFNVTNDVNAVDPLGKASVWTQLGAGPTADNYTGFQPNTTYTLVWTVERYAASNVVSGSITGGSFTNLDNNEVTNGFSHTEVDVTGTNYHRFDSFMMRFDTATIPTSIFIVKEFKVEQLPITFPITLIDRMNADQVRLRWESVEGFNYQVQATTNLGDPSSWTAVQTVNAAGGTTTFTNSGLTGVSPRFYRIVNVP